jgi:hypothetical protein
MTITISSSTESLLRERANREGKDPDDVADALLADALAWQEIDRARAAEAIGVAIKEFADGRGRPAREALEELRRKYEVQR